MKNQSKDEIQDSGIEVNEDNMIMPGIKVKSAAVDNSNTDSGKEPDLFSGGIIVKKT